MSKGIFNTYLKLFKIISFHLSKFFSCNTLLNFLLLLNPPKNEVSGDVIQILEKKNLKIVAINYNPILFPHKFCKQGCYQFSVACHFTMNNH